MINTSEYEKMTWETPSDELEDAVKNLLAEVERLREEVYDLTRANNTAWALLSFGEEPIPLEVEGE